MVYDRPDASVKHSVFEWVVLGACAYEVLAIATKRPGQVPVPPISHLCWRYNALAPAILGSLAWHLVRGRPSV